MMCSLSLYSRVDKVLLSVPVSVKSDMDHEPQDMEVFNPQLPFTKQVTQNWISGGVYCFHFGYCPLLVCISCGHCQLYYYC